MFGTAFNSSAPICVPFRTAHGEALQECLPPVRFVNRYVVGASANAFGVAEASSQ